MTIIFDKSPQGSEEWLAARKGAITGSKAKVARERLADKPAKVDKKTGEILEQAKRGGYTAKAMLYAYDCAREREGGTVMPQFQNGAMRFGSEQEEHAIRAYEARTGYLVERMGFCHTNDRKFGVSVDGDPDPDGLIEVKTMVSSETLFTAFVDGDISEYRDQCLMGMWLLTRKWCDVVLWAPDMPDPLRVIRIERNEEEIDALVADLLEFDKTVEALRLKLSAVIGTSMAEYDADLFPPEPVETVDKLDALTQMETVPPTPPLNTKPAALATPDF